MVEALWWLVGSQGYRLSFLSSSLFTIMVLFFPFLSFHMFSHFKIFYSPYFVSSLKFCSHFFLAHIISLFFFLFLLWVLFIYTPLYSSIPSYPFTFSNLSYLSTLLFFFLLLLFFIIISLPLSCLVRG
jgi:hypothetical protein